MAKQVRTKKIEETIPVKEEIGDITGIPEVAPEPTPTTEPVKYVEERQPDVLKEEAVERLADDTMEASIVKYLDGKGEGEHLLNDFIKSLFPIPKINEPAIYLTQENSRYIRHVLDNMQLESKISIVNNSHRKLGAHWYEEGTGVAKKHNLLTVKIVAKK